MSRDERYEGRESRRQEQSGGGFRGGAGPQSPELEDGATSGWESHGNGRSQADGSVSSRSGQTGPHSGKGPKGWSRSDDRLKDDVCEALARHPHIDASNIEVRCSNGEISLSGTVTERSTKRMAEGVAEEVFGVSDVQNSIRVSRGENGEHASSARNDSVGRSGSKTSARTESSRRSGQMSS